ncbi:MAG: hypothetical protein AAGF24_11245, partial [Cyanobacteria bacterium P01_H01_bin.121]
MTTWEFLLQQEGDRTWLPLETASVEILEGRYRLVAKTDCQDTDVKVRIQYWDPEQETPQRRVNRRTLRTNPKGLLAIFPFTRLRPGQWHIQCIPELNLERFDADAGADPDPDQAAGPTKAQQVAEHQAEQGLQIEVLEREHDSGFEPDYTYPANSEGPDPAETLMGQAEPVPADAEPISPSDNQALDALSVARTAEQTLATTPPSEPPAPTN